MDNFKNMKEIIDSRGLTDQFNKFKSITCGGLQKDYDACKSTRIFPQLFCKSLQNKLVECEFECLQQTLEIKVDQVEKKIDLPDMPNLMVNEEK